VSFPMPASVKLFPVFMASVQVPLPCDGPAACLAIPQAAHG
jgi:hypothetical protein